MTVAIPLPPSTLPVASITGLGAGIGTWLATPSGANLLAALTTKTGTGLPVFDTSPTINTHLTLTGGTITASDPIIDATQTWNNSGVTFTGIKSNITNTASAAASVLMDLQVGGTPWFTVRADGANYVGQVAKTGYSFESFTTDAAARARTSTLRTFVIGSGASGMLMSSDYLIGWSSNAAGGGDVYSTSDLILRRDAANTLAQRNGTNAQGFNVYGTYTSGSNYNAFSIGMATDGIATLQCISAGAGASNNQLKLMSGGGQDLSLGVGGASKWRIKGDTYSLIAVTNNLYDIGADLATSPRTGYFATSLVQGGALNLGAVATDGVLLRNTSPALVGAQQYSPAIRLTGQGWKTASTAGSQAVDWRIYNVPVQGTANPTSKLNFDFSVNGGAFSNIASLTSAGALTTSSLTITTTGNGITFSSGDTTLIHSGSGDNLYLGSAPDTNSGYRGTGSFHVLLDTNNNGTTHVFRVAKDSSSFAGSTELFSVSEDGLIRFGGTTSGFSALKRSTTILQCVLADDSGFTDFYAGSVRLEAAKYLFWNGRANISSPADGVLLLMNDALSDFTKLQFGKTDSTRPALVVNGSTLEVKYADGSDHARLVAQQFYSAYANYYFGSNGSFGSFSAAANGVISLYDAGGTGFTRLTFGGTGTSHPAWERNGTEIKGVLSDGSALTFVQGKLKTHANAVSETITCDKTITLYDASGAAVKVPCL